VLRVEVAKLKSRNTLSSACTSCLVLHENLASSRSRIVLLEAKLKAFVATSCSTNELNAIQN
jgi:dolichyl-phosphate-mannose--protein O-mannosyl transferase